VAFVPTPEQLEVALQSLLLPDERTGDAFRDLVTAARRALDRRATNSRDGGIAIEGLREQGLSWREIEAATGIPKDTAQRWAEPPGGAK
jgi:hypothetical protein